MPPKPSRSKAKRLPECIKELPNGRFRIRVTQGSGASRTAHQETLPLGTSLSEAMARVEALRAMRDQPPPPPSVPTLDAYAISWLALKKGRLKLSTMQRYATELDEHILPMLGHLELGSINRASVEAWLVYAEHAQRKDGQPYSQSTLSAWWRTLCAILRDAAADHGLSDPTWRLKGPRLRRSHPKRELRTLEAGQVSQVVEEAQRAFPGRWISIALLAFTGLRMGEVLGLRWCDIDRERGVLCIEQAALYLGKELGWQVSTPKADKTREVPIAAPLGLLLDAWRREMVATQHPGLQSGLVCPSYKGDFTRASLVQRRLLEIQERLGLEVRLTPQVLRRTFNTLLVKAGVDRIVVRSMLGHASEEMTERYSGIDSGTKALAVNELWPQAAREV